MDPKLIENLALFSGVEFFLIIGLILTVIFIVKLGPRWLDKRYQYKLAELNSENHQMEVETNAMVKEVSTRLGRLEEHSQEVQTQIVELKTDSINQKMLARDILKVVIYSENLPVEDRMEAAHDFFLLGGDSYTKDYFMKEVVLGNKQIWSRVVDKKQAVQPDFDPKQKYYETLNEIKRFALT